MMEEKGMTNREMAAVFFNIATMLREQGNINPFRTAAYERAARAMMGLRGEATGILATEKAVPFRRWQHIGRKLQAKIQEMAHDGELDQYGEMVAELPGYMQELMSLPGIGPRMAHRLHDTLKVETAEELILAARSGRLRTVPGFGEKRVREIAERPLAAEKNARPRVVRQMELFAFSPPA